MEEICADKEAELTCYRQNCLRLDNELASVRKVRFSAFSFHFFVYLGMSYIINNSKIEMLVFE